MDYCKSVGILQWSERPMTSGIFQALDQNNAACHVSYEKGKNELRQNHAVALSHDHARRVKAGEINGPARTFHTSEVTIGVHEFLRILCTVWFDWSKKLDRQTAFRRVGVTTEGLAPWLVDRSQFVLEGATGSGMAVNFSSESTGSTGRQASTRTSTRLSSSESSVLVQYLPGERTPVRVAPTPISELVTPPSAQLLRKGSTERVKRKLEQVMQAAKEWEEFQTNPMTVGMLVPLKVPAPPEKRSKKRLTDVSGSFSFNDIIGLKKKGKAETAAAAEAIVTARTDRVANAARRGETAAVNAARKVGEAATLASAWDKCAQGQGCKCPFVFFGGARMPCVILGLKKCSACGDVKKSVCAKR